MLAHKLWTEYLPGLNLQFLANSIEPSIICLVRGFKISKLGFKPSMYKKTMLRRWNLIKKKISLNEKY